METINEILVHLFENKRDRLIFELLSKGKMSFSELKEKIGIEHSPTLARSLHRLSRYGLVWNRYEKGSERAHSFYEMSPMGSKVMSLYKEFETALEEQAKKYR